MKFRWEKKYLYWGLTAFAVIGASIIFYLVLSQLPAMNAFLGKIVGILKPVIYGLVFAYLMNFILRFLERQKLTAWGVRVFPDKSRKAASFSRFLGVFITLLITLLVLAGILWMLLPRLYESLETLANSLPNYFESARNRIIQFFPDGSEAETIALNIFNSAVTFVNSWFNGEFLSDLSSVLISISTGLFSVVKELLNIAIGFIVAIYVLVSKEKFSAQGKKVIYSILNIKQANTIIHGFYNANRIFSGFISGKILDSLIIGVLCYIILTIFQMPYKELVSVIVGVTNVIPFFGPFIGAIPSAFLILLIDPMKCLTFIIIILVLQQFDGNILGPKILGDVTGLGSFWVICAILVGGGLFGFVGMLVGVPVFAIIYMSVKGWVERSLKKKGISSKTSDFRNILYIDSETEAPVYRDSKKD